MKNYSRFLLGLGIFATLGLFSCSQNEWLSPEENTDGIQTSALANSNIGDERLAKDMLPVYQKAKTRGADDIKLASYESLPNRNQELADLVDMRLSIELLQGISSKRFLTWSNENEGKNKRVTFENRISSTNDDELQRQEFYLGKFPGYGGEYIIYTRKNNVMKVLTPGQNSETKEDLLLAIDYDDYKANPQFCSWNFLGIADPIRPFFVIENNDYIEELEDFVYPWERYYKKVLGINFIDGKLEFSQYNNDKFQKFAISISEPLEIVKCTFNENTLQNISKAPDFYFEGQIDNDAPTSTNFLLKANKETTETSTYSQRETIKHTIAETGSANIKIEKVLDLGLSASISNSREFSRETVFGENTSTKFDMSYEYNMECPPYSHLDASIMVKRYSGSLTYNAIAKGSKSETYYNLSGTWEGITCVSVIIRRTTTSLVTGKSNTDERVLTREEALKAATRGGPINFDDLPSMYYQGEIVKDYDASHHLDSSVANPDGWSSVHN